MSEVNRWDGFSDEELEAMLRGLPRTASDVELALYHDAHQELERRRRSSVPAEVVLVEAGPGWAKLRVWDGSEHYLNVGDMLVVPTLVIS